MELLEKHFDTAFAAPDGIEKLRGLVLTLSIQGKLTSRDLREKSASHLLEEISRNKQKLLKEKKIRKPKPLPEIEPEALPYKLPENWEWVRLGEIATQITDGVHHTPRYIDRGVPFISIKDIDGKTVSFDKCKYISEEQHNEINKRCNPEKGDVLICRIGTLGRATIVDTARPFSLFVSVGLIKFSQEFISSEFLHLVLQSPLLVRQYDEIKAGGSHTNKLNLGDIPKLLVPLPPLPEQRRIVAKIDQLMARCDELEKLRESRDRLQIKVHMAACDRLLTAPDTDTFTQSWQFITQHFSELYSVKENVTELRKAILQLAVIGKLVPQDPNDTPVIELLDDIRIEKERLIKEEKLKTKANETVSDEEEYLEVPEHWAYCRLGNLARFIDYRGRTPRKVDFGIPLITAKNVRYGYIDREPYEYITEDEYKNWMNRGFPRLRDILFTPEAPLGNVAIVDIQETFALAQRVICFQFHEPKMAIYIKWFIMSTPFQNQLVNNATGMTAKGIKASKLKEIPIPIPPLAEQHRIVAKVDQLMTLCDTLEHQIDATTQKQTALLNAVTAKL